MKHLFICREYPPAPYPPGGIGAYVRHICGLLAEYGETVHVIAQRWEGAPSPVTVTHDGRLVVHRISADDPAPNSTLPHKYNTLIATGLTNGDCPTLAFSWQVAALVEQLVTAEGIDVIEAPEWEAPLYYYQLRRFLGLGPSKQPACLIHLHSPSELIFRHNNWDLTLSDYEPLRQCERYSIQTAHGVLSPSRYLARQSEELFGLESGKVEIIPYPLGDNSGIDRADAVWGRDSVCFAGRLELRKGIVEWVDAAVEVAQHHPTVSFDFVGSDTSLDGGSGASVRSFLWERIPNSLRSRFHFHGSMNRERLREILARTPIAVVPSRWENLPYSCIEAMCSGLPVLVSPHGGMSELIEHGESGWIAADTTSAALASALRTALETPPARRARMGQNAAATVNRYCSNQTVVRRHLELRRRLVGQTAEGLPAPTQIAAAKRRGMAVVVNVGNQIELLPKFLSRLTQQSQRALHVVAIGSARASELCRVSNADFVDEQEASARKIALQKIFDAEPELCGIAFVEVSVQLQPQGLAAFESVLQRHPEVGTVSAFIGYGNQLSGRNTMSDTDLQCVETTNDCVAVRAELLQHCADITEAAGITYPEILAFAPARKTSGASPKKRYSAMALAQRTSSKLMWTWFVGAPLGEKVRWAGRVLSQPRRVAQWLSWQLRTSPMRSR